MWKENSNMIEQVKERKIDEYIKFYKRMLIIAVPIMLQNGVSNFVGFLDNIMIGKVGTEQMTGVAIVNQLMFVMQLCFFGAVSGAGIFTAQYFGQGNNDGVRKTFRFKLVITTVIALSAILIFYFLNVPLISMYLKEEADTSLSLADTLLYGQKYLFIMIAGILAISIENSYSSTLRETGQTFVPMVASVIAVFLNLGLNYLLIFGKFGMPCLGVEGAAYATVISRVLQLVIVVGWTHFNTDKNPYVKGLFSISEMDQELVKKIIITGFPLLVNETLWAAGIAAQTQAYSVRGLEVVAGLNINSTIYNVFNIIFIALGDAVAIMVGQLLGAGKEKEAKQTAVRIMVFSVCSCVVIGSILFITAPLFPRIYNTTEEVMELATKLLRVTAVVMPLQGLLHIIYFTIRSGGKTLITFMFDSMFLWVLAVPCAYVLSHFTGLNIITVFLLCNLLDAIKTVIGLVMFKKGIWINNIVGGTMNE